MKSQIILSSVLILIVISINAHGAGTNSSKDVLAQAKKINSNRYPVPTTSYRKGHAKPHQLKNYVRKNK